MDCTVLNSPSVECSNLRPLPPADEVIEISRIIWNSRGRAIMMYDTEDNFHWVDYIGHKMKFTKILYVKKAV